MKIALSTESTVDLSEELIQQNDIKILPYTVILGETERPDGTFPVQEIFDFVKETGILPKTSAINEYDYTEHFTNLLKEYDAIIHISLSSGITSATSHAISAAKNFENVYVIDSQSLSSGIGLLALYARKLINKGLEPALIAEKVTNRVPFVQASFVIERLDYLYKGGRCSGLALFGANLLKLRPQIILKDGKMSPNKKYRGPMPLVIKNYCKDTIEQFNTPDLSEAFITYTSATEDMIANAKAALVEAGFKNIHETHAGATITSHCGEHTLGILYINDGLNEE